MPGRRRARVAALVAAIGALFVAVLGVTLTAVGERPRPGDPLSPDAQPPATTAAPPLTSAAPPPTTSPAPPAPAGTAQSLWLHLNSTTTSDDLLAQEARRRSFIVLNQWESGLIPRLKAANPAIQVYVYKDLSSTRSYACRGGVDDRDLPTGVGYCDADAHHPDWFLTSPRGGRYEYSGYPGHWQMDVGNVDYQDAWAANVIAAATAAGFDGVEMDNALFDCDTYHRGSCPPKYPTDEAMQAAYLSMLSNVRGDFSAAGLETVANLANARLHPGVWDAYTEHLDGGFDEWWLVFSDTNMLPEYGEGWSRVVAEIESNEARGKITWVQPHFSPGAVRPFRYAFASYLMAAGTRSAFVEIARTDAYGDPTPWRPEYEWRLGEPVGPKAPVGSNLWRRDFACGVAVVNANPSRSGARVVELGAPFVDQDGATVTSVSLAGTSGAVLRAPGCGS
ncbi:putative glycoside hydrolase [Pseudonocardia lacus]|uniref:putative glycoside hydrolase n=1 Tax=Pseudonocardia lacus TaxID=2835865 RepID=UPI001BDBDD4E|nr:putative glycoside hydrolase [Pseudonocardia lacus]